jgi:hypothetical protein
MGALLPSILEKEADIEKEPISLQQAAEELEQLISWYNVRKENASLEGLESIAGKIAIAFGDFILRIGNNILTNVTGLFKDVKRSSLEITRDHHRLGFINALGSDYTSVVNVNCNVYPFVVNPVDVIHFCESNFNLLVMRKRIIEIIEAYIKLANVISTHSEENAIAAIAYVNEKNIHSQLTIKQDLPQMVKGQNLKTGDKFGDIFNSTGEFRETVEYSLKLVDEYNSAAKVGKMLPNLYNSFDKLKVAIEKAVSSDFDFNAITGIASTLHNTGELLESYGLLVKEYHHLEFWLSSVVESIIKQKK